MIYVITKGSYSDYHICAVATNKEKAEELRRMYSSKYEDAEIEEFEENVPSYELFNSNPHSYWKVMFQQDGRLQSTPEHYFDEPNLSMAVKPYFNNSIVVYDINASDAATALKIAQDERAKYLAEKFGL